MQLSGDELVNVLAERFLVQPRSNFPKIFYSFDKDHSGGLDLNGKGVTNLDIALWWRHL